MKRTLICALVLLAVTASANAATLWLESGGTQNAKIDIPVGGTAQVDLYMEFTNDNTKGSGSPPGATGRALMVSMAAILRLFNDNGWDQLGPPQIADGLHVGWELGDYARDVPATFQGNTLGGLDLISRKSAGQAGNLNSYSLILQAASELPGPPYPYGRGFAADLAYTRVKVDHVVVQGLSLTVPGQWDHLFIPKEHEPYGSPSDFSPTWQEGQVNPGGTVTLVLAEQLWNNGSPNEGGSYYGYDVPGLEHILIKVTPEPTALALLALGGLAALRRRR
jgi:hypothetical protein